MVAASRDKSFPRFWFFTVDPDVDGVDEGDQEAIADFIEKVLLHPMGWRKHGYRFIRTSPEEGFFARQRMSNIKHVLHLRLSLPGTVEKHCKFDGLSCASLENNVVYFNRDRWFHGSKASGLTLDAYRVYLICHEVGHLLDRGHKRCSNDSRDLCPVMYQQTISKGCCTPNPWPLDWE